MRRKRKNIKHLKRTVTKQYSKQTKSGPAIFYEISKTIYTRGVVLYCFEIFDTVR